MNVDHIIIVARKAREERERELVEAFKDSHALRNLIARDAASVVAGSIGYSAPDGEKRDEWIRYRMENDVFFVAKVRVIENLVREYIEGARKERA